MFPWIVFASSIVLTILGLFFCVLGFNTEPAWTMTMRTALSNQGLLLMFTGILGMQVCNVL